MFVLKADGDKNDNRYYIRQPLVYLLHSEVGSCRDVQIEDIETSEEDRLPYSPVRTPD